VKHLGSLLRRSGISKEREPGGYLTVPYVLECEKRTASPKHVVKPVHALDERAFNALLVSYVLDDRRYDRFSGGY
jgi:hypothetical protein